MCKTPAACLALSSYSTLVLFPSIENIFPLVLLEMQILLGGVIMAGERMRLLGSRP